MIKIKQFIVNKMALYGRIIVQSYSPKRYEERSLLYKTGIWLCSKSIKLQEYWGLDMPWKEKI